MKFSLYFLLIMIFFSQHYYSQKKANKIANVEVVEVIDGLFFTVQLGAFEKPIEADEIFNVSPLVVKYTEGLYKYSTGIYRTVEKGIVRKDIMLAKGVNGAFVTAYYEGERITIAKAKELINELGDDIFAISEDGIVKRTGGTASTSPVLDEFGGHRVITVEPTKKGVEYFVDLGTYRDTLPKRVRNAIFLMQDYDVETVISDKGNQYVSGAFVNRDDAELARDKFVLIGVAEAKLMKYKDGVKVPANTPSPVEGLTYRVFLGTYSSGVPQARSMIFLQLDHLGIESIEDTEGTTYYCGKEALYEDAREVLKNFTNEGISIAKIVAFQNGEEIDVNKARKLTNEY